MTLSKPRPYSSQNPATGRLGTANAPTQAVLADCCRSAPSGGPPFARGPFYGRFSDHPDAAAAIHHFVERCQVVIGAIPFASDVERLRLLASLFTELASPGGGPLSPSVQSLMVWVLVRALKEAASRPATVWLVAAMLRQAATRRDHGFTPRRVPESLQDEADAGWRVGDERVRRALAFLRERYAEARLREEAVARQVRVSRSRLAHLLAEHTEFRFRDHLKALRITRGAILLTTTALSVKEIAYAAGYTHPSAFDRDFAQTAGMSPTAVRVCATRSVDQWLQDRHRTEAGDRAHRGTAPV